MRKNHLCAPALIAAVCISLLPACSSSRDTSSSTASAAQQRMEAPAPAKAGMPAFKANEIRSHVAFLASDALEGRDTGTRGYDIAARYVAANFERLGIEPGGEDGTYFQSVTLQQTAMEQAMVRVGDDVLGDEEFAVFAMAEQPTADVTGQAVFVGYGVDAAKFRINDYDGLDVKGKVVVAMIGGPDSLPSEEAAYFTSRASKARAAAQRGAVAIVFVATPARDRVVSFARVRGFVMGRPQATWVDPSGNAFSENGGIQVVYLSNAAAESIFANADKSFEALREAAETGGELGRFTLPVEIQVSQSSTRSRISSPNVVGLLRGSDPVLADQYVVLSAHLDHEGIGRPVQGDSIYNGALDNSAGVSVLLEVARAFSELEAPPRRSILFIALTAEEKGLLGSEFYAAHPTVPKEGIVADVNLDMPLLLYDFTDVVAFGAEHSSLGETVARAAETIGLTLSPDPMPEENLFTRSDHYSFVKQGVPSVFLVTGFANGGEAAFGSFLQSHYHRPSDDITLPINFEAGAKFALVNYLIASDLANADKAPTWNPGNFFGERFGTK